MTDYDHFHKQAARDADARIVARGGRSVFGQPFRYLLPERSATGLVPVSRGLRRGPAPGGKGTYKPKRWFGPELERAREVYEGEITIIAAARMLKTSPGRLSNLASKHKWLPRHLGPNRKRPNVE